MELKHSQGSALLSALLLMTLIAIVATSMMLRIQFDTYRTQTLITHDKLVLASEEAVFWAMDRILRSPLFTIPLDKQGAIAKIPNTLQASYPGVTLQGTLYDLQAKLNLNNLKKRDYWFLYVRLLQKKLPKVEMPTIYYLLKATINWIMPIKLGSEKDVFSEFYAKQKPPYTPGRGLMASISEFRLVAGITAERFNTLLPYIIALPTIVPINVNTAPVDLLMCLSNDQAADSKQKFLEERLQKGGFKQIDLPALQNKYHFPPGQITTESEYFGLIIDAQAAQVNLKTFVILRKIGKITVIISKTYGTL